MVTPPASGKNKPFGHIWWTIDRFVQHFFLTFNLAEGCVCAPHATQCSSTPDFCSSGVSSAHHKPGALFWIRLPADWLGGPQCSQRTTVFHRPQHQVHHLGENAAVFRSLKHFCFFLTLGKGLAHLLVFNVSLWMLKKNQLNSPENRMIPDSEPWFLPQGEETPLIQMILAHCPWVHLFFPLIFLCFNVLILST